MRFRIYVGDLERKEMIDPKTGRPFYILIEAEGLRSDDEAIAHVATFFRNVTALRCEPTEEEFRGDVVPSDWFMQEPPSA